MHTYRILNVSDEGKSRKSYWTLDINIDVLFFFFFKQIKNRISWQRQKIQLLETRGPTGLCILSHWNSVINIVGINATYNVKQITGYSAAGANIYIFTLYCDSFNKIVLNLWHSSKKKKKWNHEKELIDGNITKYNISMT